MIPQHVILTLLSLSSRLYTLNRKVCHWLTWSLYTGHNWVYASITFPLRRETDPIFKILHCSQKSFKYNTYSIFTCSKHTGEDHQIWMMLLRTQHTTSMVHIMLTHPDMLSSITVTHNFVPSQFHFLVVIKFEGIIVYVSFYLWK